MTEGSERRWKVYCHTNKINGKKYFGITSTSLNARFQNGRGYSGCRYFNFAIQKYGWDNFEHEIISDNLTREEAMSLEELLVFFNMTQDSRYGYNIKDGGDIPLGMSEEGRASLIAHNTGGNSPRARAVVAFNIFGTKVAEFETLLDAAKYVGIGKIERNALINGGICGGLIFKYKEDVDGLDFLPFCLFPDDKRISKRKYNQRSISVFDAKTGERLREYNSVTDAMEAEHVDLPRIMHRTPHFYNGHIFHYSDDVEGIDCLPESELNIPHRPPTASKSILQFSPDGSLLAEYESSAEAERKTGISSKSIAHCLHHKSHSAGGFVWRFPDDTSEIQKPPTAWETRHRNGTTCGKAVDKIDKNTGEIIETYYSIREAARSVNGNKANIQHAINGKNRTKCAYGYKWAFHLD